MNKNIRRTIIIVLSYSLLVIPAKAQSSNNPTLDAYKRARQVLDAGIEALGGLTRLRAIEDVTIISRGKVIANGNDGQGHRPGESGPIAEDPTTSRTIVDFKHNRVLDESSFIVGGGFSLSGRRVINANGGFAIDLIKNFRGNAITSAPASLTVARRAAVSREIPQLIVLDALNHASTVRWVGEVTREGKKEQIITYAQQDGSQLTLYFDSQTKLLTKFEYLRDDLFDGDQVTTHSFAAYRSVDGTKVPASISLANNGRLTFKQDSAPTITFNTHPADAEFDVPAGYEPAQPPKGDAALPVRKMGDGVYLLQNLPGGYKTLFVAFSDYILVLESPVSSEASKAAIETIHKTIPGKPIKFLAFSHYHHDHTGGIRGYIAEGVTVVTTPGNKQWVEAVAASQHTVAPDDLSRKPRRPAIEIFERKRVFTDGQRTVELYNVGPTEHVDEMVVAYLPVERILFQGDMLTLPDVGELPQGTEINVELADRIKSLGLNVETIIGVHGRIGSIEDLRKVLQKMSR